MNLGKPERLNQALIDRWFWSNSIAAIAYALSLRKFLKVIEELLSELSVYTHKSELL